MQVDNMLKLERLAEDDARCDQIQRDMMKKSKLLNSVSKGDSRPTTTVFKKSLHSVITILKDYLSRQKAYTPFRKTCYNPVKSAIL